MKDKLLSNLKLVIINSIVFVFLIIMLELISSLRDKTLLVDNKKQNEKINKYYDKLNSNRSVYGDSLLPPIVPNLFLYDTLIPLGSVSNYYTQFQNENGNYPIYKNDRFGFNNHDNNYNRKIDVILLGDSFVHGCCVDQNESISSNLTSMGLNTINLGAGDNSVLTELASYIEYADKFNPKTIVWFYYEGNDFAGIPIEFKSKILRKYYNDSLFSQNLINKQKQIDGFILKKYKKNIPFLNSIIKNSSLYKRLKYHYIKLTSLNLKSSKSVFYNVINKISEDCKAKNREFIFVYLPSWDRFYEKDLFDSGISKKMYLIF